ncbi:MAG: hypothetical protein ACYDCQ_19445 [Dehalococcoidia bacterium]
MTTMADLHQLVDELPADEVEVAAHLLQALRARATLAAEGRLADVHRGPRRSSLGILKDFGPAPTEDEIDEARRELWGISPKRNER